MTTLPEPDRRRVPELDGIRGLAILLVLIWHYLLCEVGAPPLLFRFLNITSSGVDLFFVLSGFLIGGILLDQRDAPNYFSVFYGRRICRIFPIYFAWLLLYVVLSPIRYHLHIGTAADWSLGPQLPLWSYATFVQNFLQAKRGTFGPFWLAPTWSLAVEEQFYLLLPLVIRFTSRRWLPVLLGAAVVAAPFARALVYDPGQGGIASTVLLFCRTDSLLLGVLSARMVRQEGAVERIIRWMPALRILFLSGLGFAMLTEYVPWTRASWVAHDSALAVAYTCLVLLSLHAPRSPLARMSRWVWLRRLGIIAYGTYLIQEAVAGFVFGFARGRWPSILTGSDLLLNLPALAVTIGLAAVSWRWFEKPIVSFGRRRWKYTTSESVAGPE
ncbi:MAG TPA: acyltransferase [Thermoanaerobaculia bacterium]|jgi:peptidoglycan/LPS O-acetylase OafA/YrhL|nr:acyltransferase [Thermoanaerobaculia bacterium]